MKILLIRFSSFGDVTQCLSVPSKLKERFPDAEIHWIVRSDLAPLLENHPNISRIIRFDRKLGLRGLLDISFQLRGEKYSHIYDAHNNLRSRVITLLLSNLFSKSPQLLRRSLYRWKRFLLFRFRINRFQQPFSGQRDLIQPLKKWGIPESLPPPPQIFLTEAEKQRGNDIVGSFKNAIVCAPSAAYYLKRWPIDYWKQLISLMNDEKFILLGGKEDTFLEDIARSAPGRVLNLAGQTNFRETCAVVSSAKGVIANDTGILHVGEQLGKNVIALMGPAPFGFPSRTSTKVFEINLECRPCSKHGKGPCRNPQFQKCLVDISPRSVAEWAKRWNT